MVAPASPHPDKRPAANRANARHSTGPRSPEGKARSAMNAVKHGLTAQTGLLPGEDAEELRRFAESVEAGLRPMGPMQKILVQRIVSVAWKLRRVAAAEEEAAREMDDTALSRWEHSRSLADVMPLMAEALGPRPRPRGAARLLADSFREAGMDDDRPVDGRLVRITAYELKLEASLRATIRELRALQKEEAFAPIEPPESPAREEPAADPAPAAAPGVDEAAPGSDHSPQAATLNGGRETAVDAGESGRWRRSGDTGSGVALEQNEPVSPAPVTHPGTDPSAGP